MLSSKFKKGCGGCIKLAIMLVLAFCLFWNKGFTVMENDAKAAVYSYAFSTTVNGESINDTDLMMVDYYSHIYDDKLIEYYHLGFNAETGEKNTVLPALPENPENPDESIEEPLVIYYYKITENITHNVTFSETDPAAAYEDAGISNNILPSDFGTGVNISYKFKSDLIDKTYYISNFEYRQIYTTANAPFIEIDTGYNDYLGNTFFNNFTEPDQDGFYTITINVYETFKYRLTDGGFELKMPVVNAPILVNLNLDKKVFNVEASGDNFVTTDKQSYNYGDTAIINVTPTEGRIVDKLEIKDGDDLILTLYGGMQTGGKYYYPRSEVHTNEVSYGNFAFAYYAETRDDGAGGEVEEEYVATVPDGKNYVVIERTEHLEDNDNIKVMIDDLGVITIIRENLTNGLFVDVSSVNYAQFNLYDGDDVSSVPFTLVRIGVTEYTGVIPTKYFVLDFTDPFNFYVELRTGYSFDESIDVSGIFNNTYTMVVSDGGRHDIIARLDDNCSINVVLKNEDGTSFVNSYTKIYISTREISSPAELTEEERQQGGLDANAGIAQRSKIPSGTMVRVYVQISPYYLMKVVTGTTPEGGNIYEGGAGYAYHYVNNDGSLKELMVTGHISLVFEISNLAFTKYIYDGDTNIGSLRVSVDKVNAYGDARFNVEFKESISYDKITTANPYKLGYDFSQMKTDFGNGFLVNYNGEFDIPQNDVNYHILLAREVFYSNHIIAVFDAQLKTYTMNYDGVDYTIKFYYDSDELYINAPVVVNENGKYFGGFESLFGEYITIGDFEPELLPEGESKVDGYYRYMMEAPISIAEDGLSVDAVILNKHYNITVVYYYQEQEADTPTINLNVQDVEFTTEFSVEGLNVNEFGVPTFPGKYNMIGWKRVDDESINYVLDDSVDFDNDLAYTYDFISNIRLVPVFSAGSILVSFYDGDSVIHSATVRYGEVVDPIKILFEGEDFVVPTMHAYNFLGFFNDKYEGEMVIKYNEGEDVCYEVLAASFPDLFGANGEGGYTWKTLDNVKLYVRWDAEYLRFILDVINPELREESEITTTIGVVSLPEVNKVEVGNFIITDTIVVSGFKPNAWNYIKSFTLNGELIYAAKCNIEGVAEEVSNNDGLVFDPLNGTITIVSANYISEENGKLAIEAEIEYDMLSYVVSFLAAPFDNDGNLGVITKSENYNMVSYRIYYKDRNIENANFWREVDESGEPTGRTGWQNIDVYGSSIVLSDKSLFGMNGLIIRGQNGVEYAFKDWIDTDKNAAITHSYDIVGVHTFKSIFSDSYDVTLHYYTYNENTKGYVQNSYEGHFWVYDPSQDAYVMDEVTTLNAYEVYNVNGKNYYISAWSTVASAEFCEYDESNAASYYGLNSLITLTYDESSVVIRLYAIYSELKVQVQSTETGYKAEVSLPNDIVGNSYNSFIADWIVVNGVTYNEFNNNEFALVDDICKYFEDESFYISSLIKTGEEITKTELESSGKAGTSRVLVVLRRLGKDGTPVRGFYAAVDAGQLLTMIG